MHILTHSHGLTRVSCNDLLLESDERPLLPFGFDSLYYEPPTGLAFKVLAGEQIPLSADEITACQAYCDTFLETADYPVFAYDDSGVFVGSIPKSEALAKQRAYSFPFGPDHPASRWNGDVWERIKASILDDGTLILDPAYICERCAITLTADEWAAFPSVPASDSEAVWLWDFAQEKWKDVADPLVFAFDEADAYVGQHKRSLAQQRGWGWHVSPPEGWPYKNTPQGWQRVEAVIYENGHYERLPHGIRTDVMLLFTREEWAMFPARPKHEQGEEWIWDFAAETWRDISNPHGYSFELGGESAGLFAGTMRRSEADAKGLGFTSIQPEHPVSKWNNAQWVRVAVVFMDDGTVHENPEALCDRCMLPLTAAEWAAWPKPEWELPAHTGGWSWNFATESWEDRREIEHLREAVTHSVNQVHGAALNRILPGHFDFMELNLTAGELLALQANPQVATPFLDARYPEIEKASLVAELLPHYTEFATALGGLSSRRVALMGEVAACADKPTLDAFWQRLNAELAENTKEATPCLHR